MSSTPPTSEAPNTMRPDPARAAALAENLKQVLTRISTARPATPPTRPVRLIAGSKRKPATDILALHSPPSSYEHFGENYAQELIEKARLLPAGIKWHMIGALQTNKCAKLADSMSNLWCVSSVDTVKKAEGLEKGRRALVEREGGEGREKLRVLVQVNTSGEEAKSGVDVAGAVALGRFVWEECAHLRLAGLMTIGAIARSRDAGEAGLNEDFERLVEVREKVARELGIEKEELELSMGMSADFEAAIGQGSDEVRVGTGIFGERPAKGDAVV